MMGTSGSMQWGLRMKGKFLVGLVVASLVVAAESRLKQEGSTHNKTQTHNTTQIHSTTQNLVQPHHGNKGRSDYKHFWPKMKFGWKIVVGAIVGFLGAAFGSAGGVGGGGIFVPMLTLIIGFDAKSSIAISKCMITGAAAATVYYNLKQRHPTLEMPVIDYDLALLFQPMLVLGVSIGVTSNVIFADWMITVLLIIIFIFMSTKAFLKGIETWKKETIAKKGAHKCLELNGNNVEVVVPKPPPESINESAQTETTNPKKAKAKVSIVENVYWKALGLLFAVWLMILALQIAKNYSRTCSIPYWLLDFSQIPVAASVTIYQAVCLYKGRRKIASKGEAGTNWRVLKLLIYCFLGLVAGMVGGLLGLGGGFILGPLFLEMGIPPQVSSATATFAMTFSASMSVVEYYLLKRFPVHYALYFFAVTTIAGFVGQHVVRKVINMLGRASIIIFILSFTILVSAMSLGGVGLADMIKKIERKEYMGFDNICSYA
ncbi:sulfite exporter TauE/SafE family protein 3 isoform X1 [Hevea brasiliensis]|uniref:sulfite exporter TauE/SafE family protein 3 isoform X1 n=1 Tax=Hevea brasiliensis TaxID=3981 RepID=UPI0025E2FA94|nr:sulfite exporter TauE/SafE family protein 3 isoform X1 [Hevea brasiliensis]XP_058005907.1 sulfite exporter TauE/SafE family protein 3 isoform X1 [Hevea brasiliensis]